MIQNQSQDRSAQPAFQKWQPGAVALQQRLDCFEIRIFLRDLTKVGIHLKAGFEVPLGVTRAAEERLVTTEVVIEDRLPTQGWRTFQEDRGALPACGRAGSNNIRRAGNRRRNRARCGKFSAQGQSALPRLAQHQVMEPQLQHFGSILQGFRDGIEFGHGFAIHPEFGVTAGAAQLPFEPHWLLKSNCRARAP